MARAHSYCAQSQPEVKMTKNIFPKYDPFFPYLISKIAFLTCFRFSTAFCF